MTINTPEARLAQLMYRASVRNCKSGIKREALEAAVALKVQHLQNGTPTETTSTGWCEALDLWNSTFRYHVNSHVFMKAYENA